ncbi:MAG: serine/threonine protein kinase [Deltaproteobacteria bacterium]|nr:serine/threonine protein kinase [Deltaproteobacteria bacterium]
MSEASAPTRRCATCGGLFRPPLVLCPRDATLLDIEGEVAGPDPLVGRVFGGRFAIAERLGEGGMGAVYRATQLSVGREVALKVLHPGFAARPDAAQRFAREARMLSRIHHPSVVTLFDFGQAESGELFLAMELLQGETLAARLERGAIEPRLARHIADGIAEALAIAHAEGIVHRDLKPENVWLVPTPTPGGQGPSVRVKVLDFGLARSVAVQATTLTGPGTIFGTPVYMSPEAIAGREVGPSADLYALGLILYEMLTGKKAFERSQVEATFTAHLVEPAPALPAEHPRALAELVRRLLEKEPARRLPSASDVRTALVAIDEAIDPQRSRTWTHAEVRGAIGAEPSATPATTGAHPTTGSASPLPLPERRRRALLVGGAIAVVVVASALVAAGTSGPRPATTTAADASVAAATTEPPATGTRALADRPDATAGPDVATAVGPTAATTEPTTTSAPATTPPPTTAPTTPTVTATADAPDVVAAPTITLTLAATPQADVRLDDQPLGKTPVDKSLPREAREATLRFTRPGYVTVVRKVRLDGDVDLKVELGKKPQEDFIVPRSP